MTTPLFSLFSALVLGLGVTAVQAQGARPDPVNATYVDGKFEVPLTERFVYLYDPAVSRDNSGQRMAAAQPVCEDMASLTAALRQARQCPDGRAMRFEDAQSKALVSEGRGLGEFALYEIAGTPLYFQSETGMDYAVALIANYAGGSGVFYSLGLTPAVGGGRSGSSLLGLGDRIQAVQLSYDKKNAVLKVIYRATLTPMANPTLTAQNACSVSFACRGESWSKPAFARSDGCGRWAFASVALMDDHA